MKEITINSYWEYIDYVEKYKGDYYFRGQANADWVVMPNIFRDLSKLKNECTEINEQYSDNSLDIIKKILKIQHYGNGTRLCDVTINPIVALYFAIEEEKEDDKASAVFIFNKSVNILLDSFEMKILLLLTLKDISTIDELQNEVTLKMGIKCDKDELKSIIARNYVINYDINLSYSNQRALLQGGTGIYFGFGVQGEKILRKGNIDITALCSKILIPRSIKNEIRSYLKKYGISKSVLYDIESGLNKELDYQIKVKSVSKKFNFVKVIIDVTVSDIAFVETDIYEIISSVFRLLKKEYGKSARIFMYVYYDEEDVRSSNWIARPIPSSDYSNFELNFNHNYHTERMIYINQEISINIIYNKTEPIVENCKRELRNMIEGHDDFVIGNISKEEYRGLLIKIKKSLFKQLYYDLQDISHGSGKYDEYYKNSNNFCMDVIGIAEDQIIYLDRNSNNTSLEYNYKMKKEICMRSFQKYIEALNRIK